MVQNSGRNKKSSNHKAALCGVFIALALVLSYLESLVPLHFAVPGVKLGLANLVAIVALVRFNIGCAVVINVGRILLSGILFGNPTVIIYSLAGAALSMLVMIIARKLPCFSLTGVSILGAVAHNAGQLIVAAILMENAKIMYYMAVLAVTGTVCGCVIGLLAAYLLKSIRF